jgi:serine/threonine protein phosphatase PrpC
MGVTAHGVTHPGPRTSNEDAFLSDTSGGVFVVADGMGGHNAGEVASGLAVEAIRTFVADEDHRTPDSLEAAVKAANRNILDTAARRPECAGMGTTVAAALVTPTGVLLTSVGDSRIYRLRGGHLTQLTQDDSWIAKLQSEGVSLTQNEIERHPMRHVLTDVVGTRADLAPHAEEHGFEPGDTMLLCSDGLHGVLRSDLIEELLSADGSVSAVAEALVSTAVANGATDNVTAVVLRKSS